MKPPSSNTPTAGGEVAVPNYKKNPFSGTPIGKVPVSNVEERVKAWREFFDSQSDDSCSIIEG